MKRDTESGAVRAASPLRPSRGGRWIGAAAVALAMMAGLAWLYWPSVPSERIDSLAVLPFENGSADPDAEYFTDGVTESIIMSLSQLPDVKVIARTSAFRYKGQTVLPEVVGQELGVEALVLGRIVQRGDALTLSAELVRASDSEQLWGARYERTAADVFAIQQDLAHEISEALRRQLSEEEREQLTKQYTANTEAYSAYVKGRYHWNNRTEQGLHQAVDYFQEAIEHDPDYALAYSGLADSYSLLGVYYVLPQQAFPQARAAARRALSIDDSLAEAHTSLAWVLLSYDRDFEQAEREFKRALELSSAYPTAYHWYGALLVTLGRYDDALALMESAVELDPVSMIINSEYATTLGLAGRHEAALRQFDKALTLNPDFAQLSLRLGDEYQTQGKIDDAIRAYQRALEMEGRDTSALGALGHALGRSGRIDEAREILARLDRLEENHHVPSLVRARVHLGLGDTDRAFEWLARAVEERVIPIRLRYLQATDPALAADLRYAELLQRIGLEP